MARAVQKQRVGELKFVMYNQHKSTERHKRERFQQQIGVEPGASASKMSSISPKPSLPSGNPPATARKSMRCGPPRKKVQANFATRSV